MTAPGLAHEIKPACPRCHVPLAHEGADLVCSKCHARYGSSDGVPVLLLSREADAITGRQQVLYDHVAHDYDQVFKTHVAEHYLNKRTVVVQRLLPLGGTVLDVGCGTGALAGWIARAGYDVVGVDRKSVV